MTTNLVPGTARRALLQIGLVASLAPAANVRSQSQRSDAPDEVMQALPQGQAVGAGRMRYLLWDVFDATLWAQAGFRGAQYFEHAFALELRYLRDFQGRDIAQRSITEMQGQRALSAEQAEQQDLDEQVQAAFEAEVEAAVSAEEKLAEQQMTLQLAKGAGVGRFSDHWARRDKRALPAQHQSRCVPSSSFFYSFIELVFFILSGVCLQRARG